MENALNAFKKKLKNSNGLMTKTGKIINPTEVHAFGIGVYHGLTPHMTIPETVLQENKDVRHEPHYAKGGFVAGTMLQWTGIAVLGGSIV